MSLRYLFALDFVAPHVPPVKNSGMDIRLLRAVNLALRRHLEGLEDAFLFVVYGACDEDAAKRALHAYGFPHLNVRFVGEDAPLDCDEKGCVHLDQDFQEDIGYEIQRWVEHEHPEALPLLDLLAPQENKLNGYRDLDWWWIGCKAAEPVFPWPFDVNTFSNLLPGTQTNRGATWLALLEAGGNFDSDLVGCTVYQDFRISATAASLCEWLHGFEGASGNDYNHFEPVHSADVLGLNLVLLGLDATEVLHEKDDDTLDEAEIDEDVTRAAVLALTERYRIKVQSALAVLGSDSALFFTLYSSIWPRYELRATEAVSALLGLEDVEFGEIESAWQFVHDGWHESAFGDL
jgi:hypothetical protein